MDIHRCRFVPYPTSAINALAFSHTDTPASKKAGSSDSLVRLAIGRANGDIEIWNPARGTWHQEKTIYGGKDRSIDGLVWVTGPADTLQDGRVIPGRPRLFSIGYTPTVTEWDLEQARPRKHANGQHGAIWCLAAQPVHRNASKGQAKVNETKTEKLPHHVRKLVGGTADGELVLYSVEDDTLEFERVIVRSTKKRAQMVCMAFQNADIGVTGCSDSTIRVFSMKRNAVIRMLSISREASKGQGHTGGGSGSGSTSAKNVITWSVRVLSNGDIASADSTGEVKIWDGRTFSLAQRVGGAHTLDVLSLAVSRDGTALASGGMDRRIALYRKANGTGRWTKVYSRRYHQHDVKALAEFEQGKMSVMVSGGPDGTPVVTPLREFGLENHRTLPHLPQCPPLAGAWRARIVISWWERTVHVWRIVQGFDDLFSEENDGDVDKNRKLLKSIVIKGDSSITSATIDPTGHLLVVSTTNEAKAFRLDHYHPTLSSEVSVSQIELPSMLSNSGATKLQISPDSQWLAVVRSSTKVLISKITLSDLKYPLSIGRPRSLRRLDRKIPRVKLLGGLGRYDRSITHVAFSPDSRMLAVADLAGFIDTWVQRAGKPLTNGGVEGEDDDDASSSLSESSDDEDENARQDPDSSWIRNPKASLIHKLPASPVVVSFSPTDVPPQTRAPNGASEDSETSDYTILAVTKTWDVETIRPLNGTLSEWTKKNAGRIPEEITSLKDLATGALWQGRRVWIYGVAFLFMLDTEQDLPAPTKSSNGLGNGAWPNRKRKRNGADSGAGSEMKKGQLGTKTIAEYDAPDGGPGRKSHYTYKPERDLSGDDEDEDMDDVSSVGEDEEERYKDEMSLARRAQGLLDRPAWWLTYKYRPLLGIVPLNSPDDSKLEVALIERPIWEVELPDRFMEDNGGRDTGLVTGT